LWIKQGELTREQRELGITLLGTFRGIQLVVNETSFEEKDGSTGYYVPPDKVLVACSANSGTMNYAGVAQPDDDRTRLEVVTGHWVPFVWFPDDSDCRKLRLASRPLPVPPSFSNWTVIHTLP
jgi:hypothetical protein